MMRWLLGGGLAVVLFFVIGWTVLLPPGRAFAVRSCPACFGFEPTGDLTYVETATAKEAAIRLVASARSRVAQWYGAPQSRPVFFLCSNTACARRLVPGYRGVLGLSSASGTVMLLPGGNNAVIAAHEWSHVELKQRVGLWNFASAGVPAWFDEGLAVLVAGDQRYLAPTVTAKFCSQQLSAVELPVTDQDWGPRAERDHMLYARAACVVTRRLSPHDGAANLGGLVAAIRAGRSFSQAWSALP